MTRVEVLLATYNGERFLRDQIGSILAQDYPGLVILARDDGSRDGTRAILEEYAERFPKRFRLLPEGEATGSAKWNFLRLIEASSAEYVCLADQDDVWKPEKVTRSMERMRSLEEQCGATMPLLVFSDLEVVDDRLERKHESFWGNQRIVPENIHRLPRMLTQNVVTGCTALMNRRLADLAKTMPEESYMHDWWIALLACTLGAAAYLTETTVLYRQHGGNVIGAVEHTKPNLVPRLRYHDKRREQWERGAQQAEALLRLYGPRLSKGRLAIVEDYVRCEQSPSRWVRAYTMLRRGFFLEGLRPTLAILWYLFDMDAAKREDAPSPRGSEG